MPIILPASGVRAGTVAHFAANAPPAGWLACNGAAVSRTLYGALFLAIGTTYGAGDGSTTFRLPDLRGEFLRGWDDGRGVDAGRVFGSSQLDEFKAHTHALPGDNPQGGSVDIQSLMVSGGADEGINEFHQSGSRGGAETRPRNVALLACIKF